MFWKNNSCAFDSFLSIFINSIKPNIDIFKFNTEDNKIIKENKDYNLYIKFINYIINNINNNNRNYFYDLYNEFNKSNKCDLFQLNPKIELYQFVPVVINYRKFFNNFIFCIKYNIYQYCTGTSKYGGAGKKEIFLSYLFIDIPLDAYNSKDVNNIQDLFLKFIYVNENTICKYCEKDVKFYCKLYNIIQMPLILTINANVDHYNDLLSNKKFMNKIFKENIVLYKNNYKLIGLITQPIDDHFISYYENYTNIYNNINNWIKFDDLEGYFYAIKNTQIALMNVRNTEGISLLIYLKI